MGSCLISIVVPVYKKEAYLRKCVDSILAQDYENIEAILVDDGSPDNCGAICDEYAEKDCRVKAIHKPNGGGASARNAGIDNAQGEYIMFTDADDSIDPDMCSRLYKRITEVGTDICVCGYKMFYDGYERKVRVPSEQKLNSAQLWDAVLKNPWGYLKILECQNYKLYKRTLLNKQSDVAPSPIRFPENYRYHPDGFFNTDCYSTMENGIAFVDFTPYNYMSDIPDSMLKNADQVTGKKMLEYMRDAMLLILPHKKNEIEKWFLNQICVNKMMYIHVAVIDQKAIPFKLTYDDVSVILRYSVNFIEKLTALLIFFLPPSLYRTIFKIYCKGTLK